MVGCTASSSRTTYCCRASSGKAYTFSWSQVNHALLEGEAGMWSSNSSGRHDQPYRDAAGRTPEFNGPRLARMHGVPSHLSCAAPADVHAAMNRGFSPYHGRPQSKLAVELLLERAMVAPRPVSASRIKSTLAGFIARRIDGHRRNAGWLHDAPCHPHRERDRDQGQTDHCRHDAETSSHCARRRRP